VDKKIKIILALQNIKPVATYRARCPHCNNKTLLLDSNKNKNECYTCGWSWGIDELIAIANNDWLEKHEKIVNLIKERKGVKQ
jgi:rRNA maturation endonuclease Nob1